MTPAQAAQILSAACPVTGLYVPSGPFEALYPTERGYWEAMATHLLMAIEAELQSQEVCPKCGHGISSRCYGCLAEEWKRRCAMAEQELARRVAAEANAPPR